MRINDYPRCLELLVRQHMNKFLEESSKSRLINKAQTLRNYIRKGEKWRFTIPRDNPVTFVKNNRKFQIDISCEIEGTGNTIQKQNILLRIWSSDKKICYRDDIDHPNIKIKLDDIGWKRVVLRFHFDLRSSDTKQPEPLYHLQIGGKNPGKDENCWFPEQIDVPRFPYPPMDIILLCEFVLMNFFQEEYETMRKKPEWKGLIKKSQELFQREYFENCYRYINDGNDTLVGNLIS